MARRLIGRAISILVCLTFFALELQSQTTVIHRRHPIPPAAGGGGPTPDATDNFNRANETPLAGNWSHRVGGSNVNLSSNQLVAGSTGSVEAMFYWSARSWASNHASEVTLTGSGTGEAGVVVRGGGGSNGAGIIANWHSNGNLYVYWFNNDTWQGNLLSTPFAATATTGDVLYMELIGTTLTVKKNGSTVATGTISTTLSGGAPGVFIGDGSARTLDDWNGYDK